MAAVRQKRNDHFAAAAVLRCEGQASRQWQREVPLMRKGAAGYHQVNVAAQKERPRMAGSFLLELGARAFWIKQ